MMHYQKLIAKKNILLGVLLLLVSQNIFAGKADIIEGLKPYNINVTQDNIQKTPLRDLYEITLGADIVYVSGDGLYLVQGEIIDLKNRISLTKARQEKLAKKMLDAVPDADKVIFKAPYEKHIVNVFTDVDCPFCKRFHKHINELGRLGITVKYLASPIAQLHPDAPRRMQSIWCADDRKNAIDIYKKMGKITPKTCTSNAVEEQLALAQSLGVNGTPTIFLENGTRIAGYLSPEDLLERIKRTVK